MARIVQPNEIGRAAATREMTFCEFNRPKISNLKNFFGKRNKCLQFRQALTTAWVTDKHSFTLGKVIIQNTD